jgi:hypothetical protein
VGVVSHRRRWRRNVWLLAAALPRAAEERERQQQADPGQHYDGEEGGLEAIVQDDERVRTFVSRQVVLGAGGGNRRDDGDAERSADLGGGVAEARSEAGLVLGDALEIGSDRWQRPRS